MLTVIAFLVALCVLIAVHEYGHYRVAVACGVRVLRFSLGFGKPLFRWQRKGSPTELVVSAIPLGGYVKMLDEREAPVPASLRHLAFNTQPLYKRAAIVAAGPAANLLLAIVLLATVHWIGVEDFMAKLPVPAQATLAQEAGIRGGEQVTQAQMGDDPPQAVRSFADVSRLVTEGIFNARDVVLTLEDRAGDARTVVVAISKLGSREPNRETLLQVGLPYPWVSPDPVLGAVQPGGAADKAGLRKGDWIRQIGDTPVRDKDHLVQLIRASVQEQQPQEQVWHIVRDAQAQPIVVTPAAVLDGDTYVGRIGAFVGKEPEKVLVRQGVVDGVRVGAQRMWEMSSMTVRTLGRMLVGQASIKNIGGPLMIAELAGKSADNGLVSYLAFLAAISVALGVMNLLPIPVLDGGLLMYYLWEAVTGKGVSDLWMERLQRGGVGALLVLMSVAIFNDLARIFG